MSLPSIRKYLNLDDIKEVASWPARMKKKVVDLAETARGMKTTMHPGDVVVAKGDLLTAYNGAPVCLQPRKRDDIPGDPFPQTVCIQLLCSV
jgi:hypothetical protein